MAERLTTQTGSNLTPETFLELHSAWRTARRDRGDASASVMSIKKKMKGAGIDMRAFDLMEKLNDLDTDEAATVIKSIVRYGTWAGMPFATQPGLFAGLSIEKPKADAAAEHLANRAEDDGYFAGKEGTPKGRNPHKVGTEPHVRWVKGWTDGAASPAAKAPKTEAGTGTAASAGTATAAKPRASTRKRDREPAAGASDSSEVDAQSVADEVAAEMGHPARMH